MSPPSSTMKMEAADSSKTLASLHNTTWHHIPEHGISLVCINYSNKNGLINRPFIAFYVRGVLHKNCYV
jgi:hypothetical protein